MLSALLLCCSSRDKNLADASDFFQDGKYEEALVCVNMVLSNDSASVEALSLKSACLSGMGNSAEALPFANKICMLRPNDLEAREYFEQLKGLAYLEGKIDSSSRYYYDVLEYSPFYSIFLDEAKEFRRIGANDSCVYALKQALRIRSTSCECFHQLSGVFKELGEEDSSLFYFEKAKLVCPPLDK